MSDSQPNPNPNIGEIQIQLKFEKTICNHYMYKVSHKIYRLKYHKIFQLLLVDLGNKVVDLKIFSDFDIYIMEV